MDTLLQVYCQGEGVCHALIKAAKVADQINLEIDEGVPPTSACDCDDDQAKEAFHPCEACTSPVRCLDRSFDSLSRLVCHNCFVRDRDRVYNVRFHNETLAMQMIRTSLIRNFKREAHARGLDMLSKQVEHVLDQGLADLAITSAVTGNHGTSYVDGYTGVAHDVSGEVQRLGANPSRRIHPRVVTVDAVFPVGDPQYKLLKHRFITSSNTRTSQSKYENIKTEMVSGKPAVGERGPWDQAAQKFTSCPVPSMARGRIWDNETVVRSKNCAEQISKWSGVRLYGTAAGMPWIGDEITNPDDLDCNVIALFCQERLQRIKVICNKKWETLETDESLYAEFIYQYCVTRTTIPELQRFRDKYGDRFGLPLTMFWNSPLRVSVAHRRHGFGMASGWEAHPSNLQQRLDNDDANYMLMESRVVNSGKMDIAEERYNEIDDIIKAIKVPTKFYDPNLAALSGQPENAIFTGPITDALLQDGHTGAGYDDEDVGEEPEGEGAGAGAAAEVGEGEQEDEHSTPQDAIQSGLAQMETVEDPG